MRRKALHWRCATDSGFAQVALEGGEGLRAHVVLDALGVEFGGFLGHAERPEQGDDRGVAPVAGGGQLDAGLGEENGAVGLGDDVAVALEAGEGAVDGHVCDSQAAGEIDDSGLAVRGGQVSDGLDVILGDFGGMLAAGLLETFGLQGGRAHGLAGRAGAFLLHAPSKSGGTGLDKARSKCSTSYNMYWFLHTGGCWLLLLAGSGLAAWAADKSAYHWANPVPRALLRELSTDRPDQTESPYTLDAGHYQLEMDFVNYTRDRAKTGGGDVVTEALSLAPLNLKWGVTNHVDVQLLLDPHVRVRTEDRRSGAVTTASGFGDVTTRLKINYWGNDEGPTALAVMPFVKWPLGASAVRNGVTEGGVMGILGFALPAGWNAAVMTEVDFLSDDAGGRTTEFVNSLTLAHNLTTRVGGYVEVFTVTGPDVAGGWQVQLDAGFTYAIDADTQLDAGCNFGVTRAAPDLQPFAGISRRF